MSGRSRMDGQVHGTSLLAGLDHKTDHIVGLGEREGRAGLGREWSGGSGERSS